MKHKAVFAVAAAVCAALAFELTLGGRIPAGDIGLKVSALSADELKTGTVVFKNEDAEIDASNASEGFVKVRWLGGGDRRIKVRIERVDSTVYTYDLNTDGDFETFPLSDGSGEYQIRVYRNVEGTKYSQEHCAELEVELRDELLPFLYPNQYVNWTSDSRAAKKAAEITKGCKSDAEKVSTVFGYVTESIEYDYEFYEEIELTRLSGYLPDIDAAMERGKGICLDYAALMAAQLRSLGIPAKLVVGYAGENYHAWVSVYTEESGWTLADPTFAANADGDPKILEYISDGENYTPKYVY